MTTIESGPPKDFVAVIFSNGRADRVKTYRILREYNYTGPIRIIIDDEDPMRDQYYKKYGNEVIEFSKSDAERYFDACDNFDNRGAVVYARNIAFDLVREAGFKYFIALDDDYNSMYFRFNNKKEYGAWRLRPLDTVFRVLLLYFRSVPGMQSLCLAQGGDHIGGAESTNGRAIRTTRKAMNSFICSVDRPFEFRGRLNEDVNTYIDSGNLGKLFLSIMSLQINQAQTQQSDGGLTTIYKSMGTYVKSFYTIMLRPSCASVHVIGRSSFRIHHKIKWDCAVPKIIRESHRKGIETNGSQLKDGAA